MNNDIILQSKQKLQNALERLQSAIDQKLVFLEKCRKLEKENNEHKTTILLLKKEAAELNTKLLNSGVFESTSLFTPEHNELLLSPKSPSRKKVEAKLSNEEVKNENEVSLGELKSMMGSKKWV
jgi:hypothetical protein